MRVLWIVQGAMKEVAKKAGEKEPVSGTWIESLKNVLVNNQNVELHILCVVSKKQFRAVQQFICNGVTYYVLNVKKNALLDGQETKAKKEINDMILKIKPQIIHVHGTEFSISLNINESIQKRIPICHSIQGLVSCIADNYFYANLPLNEMFLMERIPLQIQRRDYKRRGKSERKIIQRYKYFFGRTDWDFSHITALNSQVKYIRVRELFREEFVNSKPWDIKQIKRLTIFYAGGARVPLKGFHKFLTGLVLIKQSFPEVIVYVAGIMPKKKLPLIGTIGYGRYINRLIKNKGLSDNIVFTGPLSSEEMLKQFSQAHCYVLGSAIENSSNTLVEAMLVGVPSVVASVGGVNNFAEHNVTSYIYRFEEIEMLSYYVKKIFHNDTIAEKFSINSRKKIREALDGNQHDLFNAYEYVIDDFSKEVNK